MKNFSFTIALITWIALTNQAWSALPSPSQTQNTHPLKHFTNKKYKSGEILVKFSPQVSGSQERFQKNLSINRLSKFGKHSTKRLARLRADRVNAQQESDVDVNRWFTISLPPGLTVPEAIALLQNDAEVQAVEPNYEVSINATPNDPQYFDLWGLNNTGQTGGTPDADINAESAWDVSTGDGSVIVGVLDSGVDYTHEDLADNMWVNPGEIPGNGIDDDNNGYVDDVHGYDFLNDDGDPMDDHGHGTHVSGIIAAAGNNGIGIAGVNWNAKIMALKFINNYGFGTLDDAAEALTYATNMGVRVTNNSWGGNAVEEHSQLLYDAIAAANAANGLFVASAGNASRSTDEVGHIPASFDLPNIVSVAATDHNDELSWFSNWGQTTVDLAAPGEDIWSTAPDSLSSSGYRLNSGTSMAAPHVAGAAALLLSQVPTLTAEELKAWLMESVDTPPDLAGTSVSQGRLSIGNAMSDTDYRLTASPSLIGVQQGESEVVTLLVSTFDRFVGPLTLSAETSHPSITVSLNNNQVNAQPGDVIEISATISVDATLHANRHTFTILSTDPNGDQKAAEHYVDVIGRDFALSVAPPSATLMSGESTAHIVNIDSIEGHIGPISLDVTSPHSTITPALSSSLISLPANGSEVTELTVDTTITTPAGDYQVHIIGADDSATREATVTLQVPETIELTVPEVTLPNQAGKLERFNVDFIVENLGNIDSGWVIWGIYLSTDPDVNTSDQLLAEDMIFPGLAPATSITVSIEITLGDISSGEYYLGVIVDDNNDIEEPDESNNTNAGIIEIVEPGIDIRLQSITVDPTSALAGETLTITTVVENNGTNNLASAMTVNTYFSTDTILDPDDNFIGSSSTTTIDAHATDTLVITAPLILPGIYYVIAIADEFGEIDETNEINNTIVSNAIEILENPDLAVSDLTAPSLAGLDGQITVEFDIDNQSDFDINEQFLWGIGLSDDTDMSTNFINIDWDSISFLDRGQSRSIVATANIPNDTPVGQYYVGAIADYSDNITESDETNNTVTSPIQIIEYDSDASISGITLSASPLLTGSTTSIYVTVENSGTNSIDNISADIYLSTDSVIGETDIKLGTVDTALGNNSSSTLPLLTTLNVAAGDYYIGAIIDPGNTVSETNEHNNTGVGELIKIRPSGNQKQNKVSRAN